MLTTLVFLYLLQALCADLQRSDLQGLCPIYSRRRSTGEPDLQRSDLLCALSHELSLRIV